MAITKPSPMFVLGADIAAGTHIEHGFQTLVTKSNHLEAPNGYSTAEYNRGFIFYTNAVIRATQDLEHRNFPQ